MRRTTKSLSHGSSSGASSLGSTAQLTRLCPTSGHSLGRIACPQKSMCVGHRNRLLPAMEGELRSSWTGRRSRVPSSTTRVYALVNAKECSLDRTSRSLR